jgi:hypothetical protein
MPDRIYERIGAVEMGVLRVVNKDNPDGPLDYKLCPFVTSENGEPCGDWCALFDDYRELEGFLPVTIVRICHGVQYTLHPRRAT